MRITKFRFIILVVVLLVLSVILNCNTFTYKLMYNQLDYILYNQIAKYFIPDEHQEEFVKQKLAALLKWNRKEALPRYRNLLVYMETSAEKGISKENIDHLYNALDKEAGLIAKKAAPDAADFLLTLKKDQIENFSKEALIHKKEEQEKDSDIKEPVELKTRSTVKFLSGFYGSFSEDQIKKVKKYIEDKKYPVFDRWEYQDINQKKFIELLNSKADRKSVAEFIEGWLSRDNRLLPQYAEEIKEQRKINTELYVYIDKNIVTEKQRANAVSTLKEWISAIDSLIN